MGRVNLYQTRIKLGLVQLFGSLKKIFDSGSD